MPEVEVLNGGLEILKTADLREPLASLTVPHLRILWLSGWTGSAQGGSAAGCAVAGE